MFGFVIIHHLKGPEPGFLIQFNKPENVCFSNHPSFERSSTRIPCTNSINLIMFGCVIVHPLRGPEPEFCMPFNNFENVLISHGNINKAPIVLTN